MEGTRILNHIENRKKIEKEKDGDLPRSALFLGKTSHIADSILNYFFIGKVGDPDNHCGFEAYIALVYELGKTRSSKLHYKTLACYEMVLEVMPPDIKGFHNLDDFVAFDHVGNLFLDAGHESSSAGYVLGGFYWQADEDVDSFLG
ncbi:hypothetical protein Tco_0116184 [Tanacetum coccineum]